LLLRKLLTINCEKTKSVLTLPGEIVKAFVEFF